MSPANHTRKVAAKATEKKVKSPYRCDNCGATFQSEGERKAHLKTEHKAAGKSGK